MLRAYFPNYTHSKKCHVLHMVFLKYISYYRITCMGILSLLWANIGIFIPNQTFFVAFKQEPPQMPALLRFETC